LDLGIDITHQGGMAVVALTGDVDVATAPQLRACLLRVEQTAPRMIIDLDGVAFIDSSGLGVLAGVLKRVRSADAGGDVLLVCTDRKIRASFEITGLTRVFDFYDTVDEAVSSRSSQRVS
jgi:anti-sigma B factor antagonist